MSGTRRTGRRLAVSLSAALTALTLLATVAACTRSHDGKWFEYSSATAVGSLIPTGSRKPAEPISVPLLDGGDYTLASDLGNVVLLNFWATWCGECARETPQLNALYHSHRSQAVSFVGVNLKDNKGAARSFAHDKGIDYPIAFDAMGRTLIKFGHIASAGMPVTVLIDKHGRVAAVYLGPRTQAELNPALDNLLAEH